MRLSLRHPDRSWPLGEKVLMQHGREGGSIGSICSSAEDDQGLQHKYLTFEIPVLSGWNQCKSRNSGHQKLSVELCNSKQQFLKAGLFPKWDFGERSASVYLKFEMCMLCQVTETQFNFDVLINLL